MEPSHYTDPDVAGGIGYSMDGNTDEEHGGCNRESRRDRQGEYERPLQRAEKMGQRFLRKLMMRWLFFNGIYIYIYI